ncbi:RnfABCDGE type electron transport complex subunit D [Thiocystis violascens]|uniref:Ion-translocating oxidoreductase complex subunit D n=1 Tax=Thiocystis violascens (strain ATCC 17096 / DSM 198 / 6111) TaxID=765911 RepID=I3YDJ1_THIV6|nr:RnfABCDGE type electron transport complex subunit D [Thiocystis violascens]AFL75059.1 electron transport complex, RnfABCDGE type, D subunit [Thiocystis violascens DSM 198]
MFKDIEIRTSPHLKRAMSVDQIMRTVVLALLPIAVFAVWQFGLSALLLLLTTVGVAVATEWFFARQSGQGNTVADWSAVISGLLLGLTLPPGFPLWMAAVAAFVAIALGKALFGGLGYNVMNPALVGRAFVQAAFPVAITTWTPAFAPGRFSELIPSTLTLPFMQPVPVADWVAGLQMDGWTGATPLALQKFQHIETPLADTFTGLIAGSAGETSALLILICGLWLAWQRMLDWRIPASVMAGAVLVALPFWLIDPAIYPSPWFVLCSGGLMLAAWFMASDMVASPVTARGVIVYGLFIGALTVIIRLFGGLVEGVMYAILLGNAIGPLISSWTQPRVYGSK